MDIWDACTFWLLMNNVAMNTSVQVFVGTSVLTSLSYIPRSRTAGSYGNSMMNLLKNCQTISQSGCTILQSYEWCIRVPTFPHPCQHLLLLVFFILAILLGIKEYRPVKFFKKGRNKNFSFRRMTLTSRFEKN